jgi:uncharacterized membrane protein
MRKTVKRGLIIFTVGVVVMIVTRVVVMMPVAIMDWFSITDIPGMVIGWYIAYVVMFAAAAVSVIGLVVIVIGGIQSIIARHRSGVQIEQDG